MPNTNESAPAASATPRVVQWVGWKPGDVETTESHTVTRADLKRALGPDVNHPDVVFHRDNGHFAEVSDPEVVAFFEKNETSGFKVKPLKDA